MGKKDQDLANEILEETAVETPEVEEKEKGKLTKKDILDMKKEDIRKTLETKYGKKNLARTNRINLEEMLIKEAKAK